MYKNEIRGKANYEKSRNIVKFNENKKTFKASGVGLLIILFSVKSSIRISIFTVVILASI